MRTKDTFFINIFLSLSFKRFRMLVYFRPILSLSLSLLTYCIHVAGNTDVEIPQKIMIPFFIYVYISPKLTSNKPIKLGYVFSLYTRKPVSIGKPLTYKKEQNVR